MDELINARRNTGDGVSASSCPFIGTAGAVNDNDDQYTVVSDSSTLGEEMRTVQWSFDITDPEDNG